MSLLQNKLEKQVSDILAFPCRVDVMNKLADTEDGMRLSDILKSMIIKTASVERHIKELEKESLIQRTGDKYYLTKNGKHLYKILQQVVEKANII